MRTSIKKCRYHVLNYEHIVRIKYIYIHKCAREQLLKSLLFFHSSNKFTNDYLYNIKT